MIKLKLGQVLEQTATRWDASYQVILHNVETNEEWGWFKITTKVKVWSEEVYKKLGKIPPGGPLNIWDSAPGYNYTFILMPIGNTRGMTLEGEALTQEEYNKALEGFFQRADIELVNPTE